MFGSKFRLVAAGVLFLIGVIAMSVAAEPRAPSLADRMEAYKGKRLSPEDLRERALYIQRLEAKYQPYAMAFFWAVGTEERDALKRQIDSEYAEIERIRSRGLAAAFDAVLPALAAPHLILIALAAAFAFRPLSFVLAVTALSGLMHQAFAVDFGVYVGSPSEYYLGALLAALALGAAAWFGVGLWERTRTAPQ